ncbi:BT_3928 family protein [Xanthovirga aplysinae]|uniref:BT_3928 family protein n=1 Tax=Xanthovirga aplysinae TaxID=2529853 RepID=UPI0012BBA0CA|nr:BT_3928 family protein [Xanthovirga aplysinae]MTI31862.1 DoxX family protein [Xanthovirga aplysinae]
MKTLNNIIRYLVGALFIFSGLIKINDPVGTAIKLEEYFEVFSSDFSSLFHYLIPYALTFSVIICALEVVLGVALLIRYRPKFTAWILLFLTVFFTFLTFYSAYFNKVTDCGCFGDAIKLTPWQSFYKDIILLFFVLILFFSRKHFAKKAISFGKEIVMGIAIVANVFIARYAIAHLPFIDFRAYKIGANIPQSMQPSEKLEYKYIMEKDGEKVELDQYPKDPSYKFKNMVLINPEAQPTITDYSVWNDEGDFTEYTFEGAKLLVIVHDVNKTDTNNMEKIKELAANLNGRVETLVLTSSDGGSFEAFRHEQQLAFPYYFADATVLKTMIRSNPGIILLKDGTVEGKWHYNDVPEAEEVEDLLY